MTPIPNALGLTTPPARQVTQHLKLIGELCSCRRNVPCNRNGMACEFDERGGGVGPDTPLGSRRQPATCFPVLLAAASSDQSIPDKEP